MLKPTRYDRLKQRALDVLDLAERLCTTLPRGSSLEEECFHTSTRVLRCVALLEERPCASWALDELVGRAARLLAIFADAHGEGFIDEDQAAEGLALCEDLSALARALRTSLDEERYPPKRCGAGPWTPGHPPTLLA